LCVCGWVGVIVSRTHTRLSHAMRVTHACVCATLDRTHAPKGTMQKARCMCLCQQRKRLTCCHARTIQHGAWRWRAQHSVTSTNVSSSSAATTPSSSFPCLDGGILNRPTTTLARCVLPHRCEARTRWTAPTLRPTCPAVLNQRTAQQHSNQVWHHTARFTSWVYPQRVCRTCAATEHSSLLSRASARLLPSMSSLRERKSQLATTSAHFAHSVAATECLCRCGPRRSVWRHSSKQHASQKSADNSAPSKWSCATCGWTGRPTWRRTMMSDFTD
jgi:hypothetical protein